MKHTMTNFKEHDGMLFKMLEEPVLLTPDAELPCLTRLIQDDSRMGMFNRDTKPSRLSDFYLVARIANNNIIVDEFMESDYHRFEIIGYPVADGSKDWRNYQLVQGKCVYRPGDSEYYQASGQGRIIGKLIENNEFNSTWNSDTFMRDDSDGWQIYEPKPEPIFATGDKVTDGVIEGTIIHIEDGIADVCPSTDEYKIELRNLNHIPESPKQDDVEKPLRSMIAKAKAIGKNIRTYYQDIVFTPQVLEACLNQGKFRWWNICNWEITTREQNYDSEPCPTCNGTVKVEQPKPEPQYKVGDWVEWTDELGKTCQGQVAKISDVELFLYKLYDIRRLCVPRWKITKVAPSDVVIHIGCLSGTIRYCLSFDNDGAKHDAIKIFNSNGKSIAVIRLEALDKETRELVESLLKAQEEE